MNLKHYICKFEMIVSYSCAVIMLLILEKLTLCTAET